MNGLLTYTVVSDDQQQQPVNLYVLLPTNFDPNTLYKVLYILPAWNDSPDGIEEGLTLDLADKYDIILVGPDFFLTPWFADSDTTPEVLYDSYIPDVVVPFIDASYPTIAAPEGRLVLGYSKSGYGSAMQLVHHPDVFGRAGSWTATS